MEQEKCNFCKGVGYFEYNLSNGEERKTPCRCGGSGLEIDNIKAKNRVKDIQIGQIHKEFRLLQEWVLKNNNCKTCGCDQRKTPIGINCTECGLPGQAPWGG